MNPKAQRLWANLSLHNGLKRLIREGVFANSEKIRMKANLAQVFKWYTEREKEVNPPDRNATLPPIFGRRMNTLANEKGQSIERERVVNLTVDTSG